MLFTLPRANSGECTAGLENTTAAVVRSAADGRLYHTHMLYLSRLSTEQLACLSALSTEQPLCVDNHPRPALNRNLSSKLEQQTIVRLRSARNLGEGQRRHSLRDIRHYRCCCRLV